MWRERHHKYRATSIRYGGRQFRSKKEAGYAQALDMLKRAGEIKGWEYEPHRLPLVVNGTTITHYIPDFWVTKADGSLEIHEVKGGNFMANLGEFRIKMKLFEATWLVDHPEVTYLVIK